MSPTPESAGVHARSAEPATVSADALAGFAAACETATRELWDWRRRGADGAALEDFARRSFAATAGRTGGAFAGFASGGDPSGGATGRDASPTALPATPALGWSREHQERWQAWQQAGARWQVAHAAWLAALAPGAARGAALLAASVAESPPPTPRALFERWIDCAERAWRELAGGSAYVSAQGALLAAGIEVRRHQQALADQAARLLGMPTRTELDAVHRALHDSRRARERGPVPR